MPGVQPGEEVFYFSDFLGTRHGSYAEYQIASALVARWSVIRVEFIGDDDHGPLADVI